MRPSNRRKNVATVGNFKSLPSTHMLSLTNVGRLYSFCPCDIVLMCFSVQFFSRVLKTHCHPQLPIKSVGTLLQGQSSDFVCHMYLKAYESCSCVAISLILLDLPFLLLHCYQNLDYQFSSSRIHRRAGLGPSSLNSKIARCKFHGCSCNVFHSSMKVSSHTTCFP